MYIAAEEQVINSKAFNRARVIGILMLTQMILGIALNFWLLKPILLFDVKSDAGSLNLLIGFSTLLALLLSSLNIVFGLLLRKVVSQSLSNNIILIITFATSGFILCAVEYVKMTQYVSYASTLSQQSNEMISTTLELIRTTLAAGRNEAHFLSILMSSLSILLFYIVLFRTNLIPKSLSTFAIFACSMQLIAVGHTLFDLGIPMLLQVPLLLSQVVIPAYLIVKGFHTESITSI